MKKILLGYNDKSFSKIIKTHLEWYGYEVDSAKDSFEVILFLDRNKYDVFICDQFIQPLNGYGLVEKLKSREVNKNLKIIFSTHYILDKSEYLFLEKYEVRTIYKYDSPSEWAKKIELITGR